MATNSTCAHAVASCAPAQLVIIIVHKIEAVIAGAVSEGYHCYYFTQTKVVPQKLEDKYHGMYIDFWIWFLSSEIHI